MAYSRPYRSVLSRFVRMSWMRYSCHVLDSTPMGDGLDTAEATMTVICCVAVKELPKGVLCEIEAIAVK